MSKEINTKIDAQRKYQEDNDLPYFAPSNGYCYNCSKQIYEKISLEKASKQLITGCPICYRSYCD